MRITMIIGNTPKVGGGRTGPLRCESTGQLPVLEHPYYCPAQRPRAAGTGTPGDRTREPTGLGSSGIRPASGGFLPWRAPGDIPGNDRRVDVLEYGLARDHDALDVLAARHLVHHRLQHLFQDRAQAARAGAAEVRLVGDGL